MPETPDPASEATTQPTRLDASQDSHLENLYRAAIGPMQTGYYLPILTRFETYGRASPSWNWAACCVTLNWMLLRGLWLPAVLYLAAVSAAVLGLAAGMALADPPLAESVQWSLWAGLLTLVLLVPGFFGNAWMYRVYRKRLEQALAMTSNLQHACMLLARQASSRPRLAAIVTGNGVLAVLLAAWLWPSELHMRMWPRVSGDVAQVAAPAALPASDAPAVAADAAAQNSSGTPAATDAAQAADATRTRAGAQTDQPAQPQPAADATPVAAAPAAGPASAATATAPALVASTEGHTPVAASAAVSATPSDTATPLAAASTASTSPAASAASPAPVTAQPTLADHDPQALGPAARAAAERQATIAAHARSAHATRPADGAQAPATTTARTPAPAQASAPAPRSAARASAPAGRYLINVGLFAQPDNAARALARLEADGLPAIGDVLQTRNGQRTRVRVGPFATRSQADAAAQRIRALQLEAVVVRQ